MKKYHFFWIILLAAVIGGVWYGILSYYGSNGAQKEKPYSGKTTVVEKNSFDEFASEIVDLVKEYDGEKIDKEALSIPYYSRRLIVQGMGESLDLTSYGAKIVVHGPDDMYIMQFTTRESAEEAFMKLQKEKNIEYCEPDQYAEGTEIDEDYEAMSWGVKQIGADSYAKRVGDVASESITVAVVDSGVYKHSFLKDRIVDGGMDFIDNDMDPNDEHSHGTHVAGTIVDCTPGLNVMILPVRVLDAEKLGSTLAISLGVRYAVNQGAQVMNLSLGTLGGTSRTLDNAVIHAINRGCTVVASAGNKGEDTVNSSPAHLDECIVVSAVDGSLTKAEFSNWGSSVDFAAPGVDIISCVPKFFLGHTIGDEKASMDGTSMAAPHITALAAMIKLENPSLTSTEIQDVMMKYCTDLGESGWDPHYGWGIPCFSTEIDTEKDEVQQEKTEPVQIRPASGYEDVLAEYKMLAENSFDRSLREQTQYANEGVWNFSGQNQYSVYYRYADLAGDGKEELLISINEKEEPFNIVDIYGMKGGNPVAIIESNETVGYRSRYYITVDNRIKNVASGGALNTQISYYRLPAGGVFPELEDQYIYDGWDGDQFTHIKSNNASENITKDEYMYFSSGEDVDFESEWELLYEGNSIHYIE